MASKSQRGPPISVHPERVFRVIDVIYFGEARVDVAAYRRTNEIGRMFWLIRNRLAGITRPLAHAIRRATIAGFAVSLAEPAHGGL